VQENINCTTRNSDGLPEKQMLMLVAQIANRNSNNSK